MKVVLSIDGGGRKGIVPLVWLQELEQRLGKPAHETFDLVAGTSTGGIIATAIAAGLPVSEISPIYKEKMEEIFGKPGWLIQRLFRNKHSPRGLRKTLEAALGSYKMRDAKTKIMVTAYDIDRRAPVFFKSWRDRDSYTPLVRAAMATSAAPTFFPSVSSRGTHHVDGGVFMPSPSASALAEAIRLWPNEEIVLLSLGTGAFESNSKRKGLRKAGILGWAVAFPEAALDGSATAANYQVKQFADALPNIQYFRIQAHLPYKIEMDDPRSSASDVLEYYARLALREEYGPQFREFVQCVTQTDADGN